MAVDDSVVRSYQRRMLGLCGVLVLSVIGACASETPKSPPPPTADQVRSHADRAFEKLKQEERERAAQPPVSRR